MLELALVLPILLMVMALIINFGTVACWKVRDLIVARHALWQTRWMRSWGSDPRPAFWPAAGQSQAGGIGNTPALDDPRVNQPVARGPLPAATVHPQLLDPTRGAREGSADLTRDFPLLAKIGPYRLRADGRLLDDQWQFPRMGMSSNVQRRIPILYALAKAPASMSNAYIQAVLAIARAPFLAALAPLDRDDEFIRYRAGAPDFHPYLRRFCSTDRELVDRRVGELIDRIRGKKDDPRVQGVPERMTSAFIGLYRQVIAANEAMLKATPPPPNAAQLQAEIDQLKAKIDTLNEFLQKL